MALTVGSHVVWAHPRSYVSPVGVVVAVRPSRHIVVCWPDGRERAYSWEYLRRGWIVEKSDQMALFAGDAL